MKKVTVGDILQAFSPKSITEAANILVILGNNNISVSDLQSHVNEKIKENSVIEAEKMKSIRGRKDLNKAKMAERGRSRRSKKQPFLLPGQSAKLNGIVCEKCGGNIIYEALCGKAASKYNCIRLGMCDTCSKEIRIR